MKEGEPTIEVNRQTTDTVLMVYPDTFKFNPETAATNSFMKKLIGMSDEQTNNLAKEEHERAVQTLRDAGVEVHVIHSPEGLVVPDAVYPNNWFSHHGDKMVDYPMRNQSRSLEHQAAAVLDLLEESNIARAKIVDLTYHEKIRVPEVGEDGVTRMVCSEALEGTGSMVLDRTNKIAYAIESPRTNRKVFGEWCKIMGFDGLLFHGVNDKGPIYHTNVIMGIGDRFSVLCTESISDPSERKIVKESLTQSGRELIEISLSQVDAYCGNILELKSKDGEPLIVMSKTAHDAFAPEQISKLEKYGKIVVLDIPIIESNGGSARCIIAEIFKI